MNLRDKISKASRNHFSVAKDVVLKNVAVAAESGNLKIDSDVLPSLLALVNNSLDEGYHKGHRVFDREVNEFLSKSVEMVPVTKKKLIGL